MSGRKKVRFRCCGTAGWEHAPLPRTGGAPWRTEPKLTSPPHAVNASRARSTSEFEMEAHQGSAWVGGAAVQPPGLRRSRKIAASGGCLAKAARVPAVDHEAGSTTTVVVKAARMAQMARGSRREHTVGDPAFATGGARLSGRPTCAPAGLVRRSPPGDRNRSSAERAKIAIRARAPRIRAKVPRPRRRQRRNRGGFRRRQDVRCFHDIQRRIDGTRSTAGTTFAASATSNVGIASATDAIRTLETRRPPSCPPAIPPVPLPGPGLRRSRHADRHR
jgi:hypothetical protein